MKRFQKSLLAASVAAALAAPAAVMAQGAAPSSPHTFTGNVGLFSQYIFRGLTQTDGKPALQGGFDYAHAGGFYAGVWASNVSWLTDASFTGGSYSLEVDTYLGFKMPVGDVTFDVGFLRYNYPGRTPTAGLPAGVVKPETNEIYLGASWKFLSAKYSYSLGDTFGVAGSKGSDYLDLTATLPLGDTGFNLIAHYGKQTFKGTNAALWGASGCTNRCYDYTDYRLGVTKELFGLNFSLMYTRTNADALAPDGTTAVWNNNFRRNIGDSTWTIGVQKTF